MRRPKLGRRLQNRAKQLPINKTQAAAEANRQIALRELNPDYDLVIKRISSSVSAGLRCGSPPPIVT